MAELHFCTVCGVSVPQADVDSGSAAVAGERCVCLDCNGLIAGALPRPSSGAGWIGLALAALVGVGAAWVWYDAQDQNDALRSEISGAFETQASAYNVKLGAVRSELREEMSRDSGLVSAQFEEWNRRLDEVQSSVDERLLALRQETEQLAQLALEIETLGRRIAKTEAETTLASERSGESRGVLESLRSRVELLESGVRDIESRGPVGPGEGSEAEFAPQIAGLVRQLRSSDQDERLDALEKLSSQEDERLIPHLIPMLTDPYEFNRFYAAKTLGDWRAKPATPHLIEALLDEIAFVRQAAVQSLRLTTGQNFRFDHQATEDQRQAAYEAWKTWWGTNGKGFLES